MGDPGGARRAVARLPIALPISPTFQSTYLREAARLGLQAGDTVAAVRALGRYVSLRGDPEPALRAQRDSARAPLSALVGR